MGCTRRWTARLRRDEQGQGTVEYVLVMIAVTAVAVTLITWARSDAGGATLTGFFTDVIGWVSGTAGRLAQ
jgi:Flp pilus assembly pilin Flp